MTPDFEKRLNDELNKASAKDVIPGFDHEMEWEFLSKKMPAAKTRVLKLAWPYAAGTLLLLTAGLYWSQSPEGEKQELVSVKNPSVTSSSIPMAKTRDTNEENKTENTGTLAIAHQKLATKRQLTSNTDEIACRTTNDVIHNGTPCPLELRISQTMKCPNIKPEAISSSSTLQPEQSAQLNYKEKNNKERNCSLTINEIEIKSIATGEVILLNSSSSPSMQEVFCYLTGEKEGNILAGVFNNDCDKKNRKHNLRLDNRDGKLILE
jgi:hypothetical protein